MHDIADVMQGALMLTREARKPDPPPELDRRFLAAFARLADSYPSHTPSSSAISTYWKSLGTAGPSLDACIRAMEMAPMVHLTYMPSPGHVAQMARADYLREEIAYGVKNLPKNETPTFERIAELVERRRSDERKNIKRLETSYDPDERPLTDFHPALRERVAAARAAAANLSKPSSTFSAAALVADVIRRIDAPVPPTYRTLDESRDAERRYQNNHAANAAVAMPLAQTKGWK